ncbi:MAG: PAS domain S-box protein [Planctomycetota bacterium]|nr:MAG: PAS domain S-box protein [Planctomycetota bacterium]
MSNMHSPDPNNTEHPEVKLYRDLLAQQTELMVQVDDQGRFIFVSDSYCQLFGKQREELLGQSFMPLVHPDDQDATQRAMQALWRPPYQCYLEQRALTRRGWRWLAWRDRTILDAQGVPRSVIGTAIDITERKQALAALQESEERYRQLFMHMQEAFCLQETIVDEHGAPCDNRILAVNPAFELLMGMPARELKGKRIKEIFPEIEEFWVVTFGEVALTQRPTSVEHFSAVRNRHYRVSAYSPRQGQFAAFVNDVTEAVQQSEAQHLLDQRIQKTQKLEALSLLAAGVSHDFNNILMAIIGHADLAHNALSQGKGTQAVVHMNEIRSASQRARELCQHMMSFAGSSNPAPQDEVDLQSLIAEITRFLSSIIEPHAEVHLDLAPNIPPVIGDANALRQVIMNLITNARDAIGTDRGRIIISLQELSSSATLPAETVLSRDLSLATYAVIQVCDNGIGMSEQVQNRIFEPFFSTKDDGKGLGLAATLGIINAIKGDIHIASTPGHGTVISLFLPIHPKPSAIDNYDNTPSISEAHRVDGHILFADDDPILRELGKNMMESMGLRVTVCSNGIEALEIYDSHPEPIDAIILDISMPYMGGIACAQTLRNNGYTEGIILSSGYDYDALEIPDTTIHNGILEKPYSMDTLQTILCSVLHS